MSFLKVYVIINQNRVGCISLYLEFDSVVNFQYLCQGCIPGISMIIYRVSGCGPYNLSLYMKLDNH